MKQIFYAAERDYLERYLKEKARCKIADFKAVTGMLKNQIPEPCSNEAVNKIYSVVGNTAYIKINGFLSPEGPDAWDQFFGYTGTSYLTIQAAIDIARDNRAVEKVIFKISSPGGTVEGCDEVWAAHKALAAKKLTEVHAIDLLVSSAYEIATPARKILTVGPSTLIGGIGILVATYDWTGYEEKLGIKEVIITSSNAPDKHPDISTEKGRSTIRNELDALERIFFSRISESRAISTEHIAANFGHGGLMVARDPSVDHEDAIRVGMIDGLLANEITLSCMRQDNITEEEDTMITHSEFLRQSQNCEKWVKELTGEDRASLIMALRPYTEPAPASLEKINDVFSRLNRNDQLAFIQGIQRGVTISEAIKLDSDFDAALNIELKRRRERV